MLEDRIEALIAPVVAAGGYELVRVRVKGGEVKTVQIMAERPDRTMSAEDCAGLSREFSPILENADLIADAWRLEVSSPGIDRPLVRLKDFHDWQGYEAKIELDRLIEGVKKFRGVLAGVDGDHICLDIEGEEETALIPFTFIVAAKLVLTDDMIRDSFKASKAAQKVAEQSPIDETSIGQPYGDPQ
ncbi:MAG: ribosome maturation factor RimP [Parvularculaceae bacterium]